MNSLPPTLIDRLTDRARGCRAHPWVPVLARILTAGRDGQDQNRLARLFPLFLLADARSGRVLLERSALAALWKVNDHQVETTLRNLERHGFLHLRTPGRYLVLFVRMWSRGSPPKTRSTPENQPPSAEIRSGAVLSPPSAPPPSGSPRPLNHNAPSGPLVGSQGEGKGNRGKGGGEVRGLGRGEEGWRDRFVETIVARLGCPDDRDQLRGLCAKHPRSILERALTRTLERPRRNSAAYFTKLVTILHREHA